MEVVYYFNASKKVCPVLEYLSQYSPTDNIIINIIAKIRHIKEDPRSMPGFVSSLHNHSFFEIKQGKNKDIVIRILFHRSIQKIVLLYAFEKPSHYDKNRINQEVEKEFRKADAYLKDFLENPNNYKKTEI